MDSLVIHIRNVVDFRDAAAIQNVHPAKRVSTVNVGHPANVECLLCAKL